MKGEKNAEEVVKILNMQEDILQFEHFTNEDAIELGNIMLSEAKVRGLSAAISIRRSNGAIVFQAMMDGTTPDNIDWIERKFNTVMRVETSSLLWFMKTKEHDITMQNKDLPDDYYATCGGGFPVRIEEAGVIGAIMVSGLSHVADHDFIVKCLSKYLHTDEVPRIQTEKDK